MDQKQKAALERFLRKKAVEIGREICARAGEIYQDSDARNIFNVLTKAARKIECRRCP